MRLGDLDALRKQFDDIPVFIGMTGGCVQQFIDKQPTIDAVPVVRCGECAHRIYKIINEEVGAIGGCELYGCATPNDHYCSFGEKVKVVLD